MRTSKVENRIRLLEMKQEKRRFDCNIQYRLVESTFHTFTVTYLLCKKRNSGRCVVSAASISNISIGVFQNKRHGSEEEEAGICIATGEGAEKSRRLRGTENVIVEDVCGCVFFIGKMR